MDHALGGYLDTCSTRSSPSLCRRQGEGWGGVLLAFGFWLLAFGFWLLAFAFSCSCSCSCSPSPACGRRVGMRGAFDLVGKALPSMARHYSGLYRLRGKRGSLRTTGSLPIERPCASARAGARSEGWDEGTLLILPVRPLPSMARHYSGRPWLLASASASALRPQQLMQGALQSAALFTQIIALIAPRRKTRFHFRPERR